jgi:hypothetical protein
MEQSRWQVRRARLVDVPAVARLLGAPPPQQWRGGPGLSARTITSATRLLLTHIGLEHGQFWVAVGGGQIRAAVVLLPPAEDAMQRRMHQTLRLELGLNVAELPEPIERVEVPESSWVLLVAPCPASPAILSDLLTAALDAGEVDGFPVLTIQPDLPAAVLAGAGFQVLPVEAGAGRPGLFFRPPTRSPVSV